MSSFCKFKSYILQKLLTFFSAKILAYMPYIYLINKVLTIAYLTTSLVLNNWALNFTENECRPWPGCMHLQAGLNIAPGKMLFFKPKTVDIFLTSQQKCMLCCWGSSEAPRKYLSGYSYLEINLSLYCWHTYWQFWWFCFALPNQCFLML